MNRERIADAVEHLHKEIQFHGTGVNLCMCERHTAHNGKCIMCCLEDLERLVGKPKAIRFFHAAKELETARTSLFEP